MTTAPSGPAKIAVVGNPGAWSTERLAESVRNEGLDPLIVQAGDLSVCLSTGQASWRGGPLPDVAGVIVKKLGLSTDEQSAIRLLPLTAWARQGVPVLSEPDRIGRVLDRYRMTLDLAQADIPLPRTLLTESPDEAADLVDVCGRAVIKPRYTSKGQGMLRVDAPSDVRSLVANSAALGRGAVYLQEFVQSPGRDIGVVVVGDAVAGAYARVAAEDEWRTTTAAGGRYAPVEIDSTIESLALRVSRVFGLDFTTVDVVETERGPLVYEASALGGFRGLFEAAGIDAARLTVRWALKRFQKTDAPAPAGARA